MATIDIKSGVTSSGLNLSSTTLNVSSGGKIIDTVLNDSSIANLYAGAQASNTDLNSGAQIRVYSGAVLHTIDAAADAVLVVYTGGTASGVTLDSAAKVHFTIDATTNVTGSYVGGSGFSVAGTVATNLQIGTDCSLSAYLNGGSAVNITQTGNGRLNFNVIGNAATYIQGIHQSGSFLLSNGVASGFLLNKGVVQNVLGGGITSDTILYGDQFVSGGTTINTVVYGNQLISAGGKIAQTDVRSGGKIIVVSGSASDVTLSKGGSMVLTDGAATDVTLLSGGIIQIIMGNSSAVINGTAGEQNFTLSNNIASGFTLYAGGLIKVMTGTVLDTVISSGGSVILNSGLLRGTVIFKGGTANISGGTAQSIEVSSGGKMLLSGGVAEGSIIGKNGLQGVSSGGVAEGTIATGSQFVYAGGSASGTYLLSGGRLSCFASAVVEDVTVDSGAKILISGAASELFVCSGGTAFVYKNSLLNGSNVLSGGAMNFSGGAAVRGTLDVYGGLLTFSGNNVASDAIINLDLTGVQAESMVPMLKGYDNLSGDFTLNAKLSAGQVGAYYVASSAATLTSLNTLIGNAVGTLQAGSSFVDYANQTEYTLTGAPGYVYVSGEASTTALAEITGTAAMETVNGTDKGAKWGDNTTFENGSIFAGNGAANNVWLEVNTKNSAAETVLYGGAATGDVAGQVSLDVTSGSFKAILGGAAAATGSVGSVDLAFSAGTTGVVYGAGFGSVAGDVSVTMDGSSIVNGQLYGGAMVKRGEQSTVGGTISLELNGGTLTNDVIGGARMQADTIATTAVDAIVIDVDGTSFTGGAGKSIYGAGWIFGKSATAPRATGADYSTGDVTIRIKSDVTIGSEAGRGIFGGVFAADYAIAQVAGNVNISVTGATVGNIFGGGWAQSGAKSNVTGNVSITLANAVADTIYGGGAHGSNSTIGGTTNVGGNISITVSNSTIRQIHAVGQLGDDTVTGASAVTISGNSTIDSVFGTRYDGSVGGDSTTLSLKAFTGNINKTVAGFNRVDIDKDTAATFASDAQISGGRWNFQLESRTTDKAVLTWQNGAFETADFNLVLGTDAADWTICDLYGDDPKGDAFAEVRFNLEIAGTTISDYALGSEISGTETSWDGARLNYSEDTGLLKFTLA